MKLYKLAKTAIRRKVPYTAYRYEYMCPFCTTIHITYANDDSVLMVRCSHCNNKIKFQE